MKLLVDTILFLAWITAYLAAVFWVGCSRRARAHALGLTGRIDYRADKDVALRILVFMVGVVSFFLMYLATQALSRFL
jgi:hypothetical protein